VTRTAGATILDAVVDDARPLTGAADDYDTLFDAVGDRAVVLVGEATHGTEEFYRERARITQRLIEERGFEAVAVEADWPDAWRVNRYVLGRSDGDSGGDDSGGDADADEALGDLRRFPAWMWRNTVVRDFVEWLRGRGVGFYGLDLYSLRASIDAVVAYLDGVDPEGAARARARYACLDHVQGDFAAVEDDCEDAVVAQLVEVLARSTRDGDDAFSAAQNARLVANAEAYYRTMYRSGVSSWNLRDRHMADTLDELRGHLRRRGGAGKVVVWEHNSHVGDARATELGYRGEWSVGQLARERHGEDVYVVGFTTYQGEVTAASDWGGPAERKRVRPALPGSYEELFHGTGLPAFVVDLTDGGAAAAALAHPRPERAIGVVYRPQTERVSHWFDAMLPEQFDAVVHIDRTHALEPLEPTSQWTAGEPPETFPSGF
jgi:erythromycin esterase-like protein